MIVIENYQSIMHMCADGQQILKCLCKKLVKSNINQFHEIFYNFNFSVVSTNSNGSGICWSRLERSSGIL